MDVTKNEIDPAVEESLMDATEELKARRRLKPPPKIAELRRNLERHTARVQQFDESIAALRQARDESAGAEERGERLGLRKTSAKLEGEILDLLHDQADAERLRTAAADRLADAIAEGPSESELARTEEALEGGFARLMEGIKDFLQVLSETDEVVADARRVLSKNHPLRTYADERKLRLGVAEKALRQVLIRRFFIDEQWKGHS